MLDSFASPQPELVEVKAIPIRSSHTLPVVLNLVVKISVGLTSSYAEKVEFVKKITFGLFSPTKYVSLVLWAKIIYQRMPSLNGAQLKSLNHALGAERRNAKNGSPKNLKKRGMIDIDELQTVSF